METIKRRVDYRMSIVYLPLIILGLVSLTLVAGCGTTRTETREEVSTNEPQSTNVVSDKTSSTETAVPATGSERTVERTTTTVTTPPPSPGIISTTWHILGEVLAFPFQILADVIKIVF